MSTEPGTGAAPPGTFPAASGMADDAWKEFNCRKASAHRRHGDPFPLPRLGQPRQADPLRRRLDGAFGAVNSLASAVFEKTENPDLPLTRVQLWMMNDLGRRVSNYGEKPDNMTPDDALRDLGCGANLYSQEANHVADLDIDQIKILSRQLDPKPASALAPPEVKAVIDNFADKVERSTSEIEAMRASGSLVVPHWDPKLKKSLEERMKLYQRLFRCGLLTFRRRQKAKVGMFAVVKKGNKPGNSQRLIVDCRQANMLQRRPPTTRLSTPASLSDLDFSIDSLHENGYDIESLDQFVSGIETGDVGDCFYNFVIEHACSWFSTGDIVDRAILREHGMEVTSIFDDLVGDFTDLLEGEEVYVCFRGVPMGWSWALWLSNEIVCHQCLLATGGTENSLIRDRRTPPLVSPDKIPIGVYVDNVHTFSIDGQQSGDEMDKIAKRFQSLGIPFEVDNVCNNKAVDTLGLTFFFEDGLRVRSKKDRAWRLWLATKGILSRRRVSGEVLRVWLGHVNYHFLLCRPLLSTLSSCYSFCHSHLGHRFPLWPSVRKEIKLVLNLIFTVEKNLSAPLCPEVHVGDSSDRGYGLLVTSAPLKRIKSELQFREKWRFLESQEPEVVVHNGGPDIEGEHDFYNDFFTSMGCKPHAGLGPRTAYGRHLDSKMDQTVSTQTVKRKQQKLFGKPLQSERSMIQVPGIPEVSPVWTEPTQWDLVTAAAWKFPSE